MIRMESVSVWTLLLLFSVVGAGELQDNEILQQNSFSVPEPQPCPADIHSVLRDMSAALAEHRVRIQVQTAKLEKQTSDMDLMKQQLKAQAAKLGELEKQTSDLDSVKQQQQAQAAKLVELEKQTSEVDPMKQQLQAQTDKLEKQTSEVDALKQQQQTHASELNRIRQWTNVTDIQVEALKRDKTVGQVAFSASVLASGSGNVGPYNTQTPLVFRNVISNIGNTYNPDTGFFIAPVRGAYHFELYIHGPGGSHSFGAALVKNGQQIFFSFEGSQNPWGTAANGATLLLEAGDIVFVRQWENTVLHDNQNHNTMFTGHLLFTM